MFHHGDERFAEDTWRWMQVNGKVVPLVLVVPASLNVRDFDLITDRPHVQTRQMILRTKNGCDSHFQQTTH
ncbi:unnamed protein product [Larinioides sclopetarius]|uniref:Uncharacterized protein n=1 Tax=Larinioides sclopetarius TaxID=280406 RepID=A0AAV2AIZ9_9ARAC